MTDVDRPRAPNLPPGRYVDLGNRGTTFVREVAGPDTIPVMLLHGWVGSADLNWAGCYDAIGTAHPVVALDHRGHGRGLRQRKPFRLRDCADDATALADALGIDRFIAVGYSMGGCIAQLAARRHPERVAGVVLSATAQTFSSESRPGIGRWALPALARAARLTPRQARLRLFERLLASRDATALSPWALDEIGRADPRAVLEAGAEIAAFDSSRWTHTLALPTAVVVTETDSLVSPDRQRALARAIPNATIHSVDGDHVVVARRPSVYIPVILAALTSVSDRIKAGR